MRGLIERYVREMVKIPSTSNTEMEKNCADYIAEELAKQPYFKEHPEQTGKYLLPEDSLGRSVPWGLVKGNGGSRKTIILTGHYDVVDTEESVSYTHLTGSDCCYVHLLKIQQTGI